MSSQKKGTPSAVQESSDIVVQGSTGASSSQQEVAAQDAATLAAGLTGKRKKKAKLAEETKPTEAEKPADPTQAPDWIKASEELIRWAKSTLSRDDLVRQENIYHIADLQAHYHISLPADMAQKICEAMIKQLAGEGSIYADLDAGDYRDFVAQNPDVNPEKLVKHYYRKAVDERRPALLHVLVDATGIPAPKLTQRESNEMHSWSISAIPNGTLYEREHFKVDCSWSKKDGSYVAIFFCGPYDRDYLSQLAGYRIPLSPNPDEAGQAMEIINKAIQSNPYFRPNVDFRGFSTAKTDGYFMEQYMRGIYTEVFPQIKNLFAGSKDILKKIEADRDALALQTFLERLKTQGGSSIHSWISFTENEIRQAGTGRTETVYLNRLHILLDRLKKEQTIEIDRSKRLQATMDPKEKDQINKEIKKSLSSVISQFEKEFVHASDAQKAFKQSLLEKGLVEVEARKNSVVDHTMYRTGTPVESGWRFGVKGNKDKSDQLSEEAMKFTVERHNQQLYGITEAERNLQGEAWTQHVTVRKSEVVKVMEQDINRLVQNVKGHTVTRKFDPLFLGRFEGQNELVTDRKTPGETEPNSKFLFDLVINNEALFERLLFQEPTKYESDINRDGRAVLIQLIALAKKYYPESDSTMARTVDKLFMKRETVRDEMVRKSKEEGSAYIRGYTTYGNVHYHTLATERFTQYNIMSNLLGLTTSFDEVIDGDEAAIRGINPSLVLMKTAVHGNNAPVKSFIAMYEKHFGPEETKNMIWEVLFPATIQDDKKKKMYKASQEMGEIDVGTGILRFLRAEGKVTLRDIRAKLSELRLQSQSDSSNQELEQDIRTMTKSVDSVFHDEIHATLDVADELGLDAETVKKLTPEKLAALRKLLQE